MALRRSAGVVCAIALDSSPNTIVSRTVMANRGRSIGLPGVCEPRLLKVHKRSDDAGGQDDVGNEVISQFSRNLVNRKVVRILTGSGKPFRQFPNRVMAGHEHDSAPLKNRDAVVLGRKRAFGRLKIERVMG